MPRLVAASISRTSTALPARISVQDSQIPQGSATGWSAERQFSAMARIRATVVFPMSAENVAVSDPFLLDRILERAGNMLLSNDFGELLWPVFARENLIAHGRETTIIRDVTPRDDSAEPL